MNHIRAPIHLVETRVTRYELTEAVDSRRMVREEIRVRWWGCGRDVSVAGVQVIGPSETTVTKVGSVLNNKDAKRWITRRELTLME